MKRSSLVNRLHSHYKWQKFFSLFVTDLFMAVLVFVTWAVTVESTIGGSFTATGYRGIRWDKPHFSLLRLWDGLTYRVEVQGGVAQDFDMAPVMRVICLGLLAVGLVQIFLFCLEAAADKHTIRRILRPLDDIALTAERLSGREEAVLFGDDGERSSLNALADALDHIDDLTEEAHITVQERELASLEAAVNNMLRRLAQSQNRQIRFVDDASHELRTPIAVIQGYIGMLDRWGKEDPRVMEEAIGAIKSEAEHMKTLVDQLLFLARGESDRLPLHREVLDGCEILRELWEEYRMIDPSHQYILHLPQREGASVEVDRENEEELPPLEEETMPLWIRVDGVLLKQSLRTMLDNAKKFTPAGGRITLIARCVEGQGSGKQEVILEIADSGPGIPSEDLPRIFDRFWRGSAARSALPGSGLGLSIAKWIVERHGGRIDAASAPGLGLRIGVVLGEVRGE